MKGQVSFEAMISVGMLMFVMAAIAFGINSNINSFSVNILKDSLSDSCARMNNAVLTALNVPNSSVNVLFSQSFNISFGGGNGLTISRNGFEYLCLIFTDTFVNSSLEYPFSFFVLNNLTFFSQKPWVVVS